MIIGTSTGVLTISIRSIVKLKKCSFLRNSTTFLGFDVTLEGMRISDSKVQNLSE